MTMHFDPTTGILESIRDQSHVTWPRMLSELIDNAVDAGATQIKLQWIKKGFQCEDNGTGCSDCEAMLQIGNHCRQQSTKLGRFGFGLKQASVWMWGRLSVRTVHKAVSRCFWVDWERVKRTNKFEADDPVETPANGQTGTLVSFENIRPDAPSDYDRLAKELSFTFTPGLLRGLQVTMQFPRRQPIVLRPYEWPVCEEVIEDEFFVGKNSVRLRVGIVKEGIENHKPGFTYCHHHRVILPAVVLGAKDQSTQRICGQVFLGDGWKLATLKDDVTEQKEALANAVYERSAGLLTKSQQQASFLQHQDFQKLLNLEFQAAVRKLTAKAKRKKKGDDEGTKEPTGRGGKHTNAAKKQPGESMPDGDDNHKGGPRVEWKPFDGDEIGEVDSSGPVIWLNKRIPKLWQLREDKNVDALVSVATGLYVWYSKQYPTKFIDTGSKDDSEFPRRWGKLFSGGTVAGL